MQNWLKLGDWNAICDSCGRKFKASTMRKRWDGLFVCHEDFEYKHPQLSLKVQGDKQQVPIPRPEPTNDTFLSFCDIWSSSPMADFGTADCAFVGGNTSVQVLINIYNPVAIANYAITGRSIPGVLHT
jgi:hypothetical protein